MIRVAEHVSRTDTGHQRATNEDSHLERAPIFVVADGMGGAQAGEVASQVAIGHFSDGLPGEETEGSERRLARAVLAANAEIHALSEADSRRAGMGTTLTAAYVGRGQVSFAHVGDSRAYRLRDGELERITEDHSLVEELLRQGRLTEEEAEEHPQRSIITRALGPEPDVEVDTFTVAAADGDVYLLCSDGLTSMVSEATVADIMRAAPDIATAADRLVAAALDAGGRDNVTVVLFRIEEVGGADDPPTEALTPVASTGEDSVDDAPATGAAPAAESDSLEAEAPTVESFVAADTPVTAPPSPPRRLVARPARSRRRAPRMPRAGVHRRGRSRLRRRPRGRRRPAHGARSARDRRAAGRPGRVLRRHRLQRAGDGLQRAALCAAGRRAPLHQLLRLRRHRGGAQRPGAPPPLQQRTALAAVGHASGQPARARPDRRPVNQPIARLFLLVLVLFGLLVAFTSRWTVFDASALRANANNARPGLEAQRVQRGAIVADDSTTLLADSVKGTDGVFSRRYPFKQLFAPALGYYDPYNGRTGLEAYRNGVLAGSPPQQSSIIDQFEGKRTNGDEVVTTLNVHAQEVAYRDLAGRDGAVLAMVPSTGAIKVFAASPTFDPNQVRTRSGFASIQNQSGHVLVNRAVAGQYTPGSTFKVVTSIAAIDSGRYTPNSVINGRSPITVSGQPLSNDGGTNYGPVPLSYALTNSINTVFAQVAQGVGAATLQTYMNRLGFYNTPPIDLPSDEVARSGVIVPGHTGYLPVTSGADIGRVGIGEGGLEVTPLQMLMVVSAVANGGRLMVPHLTARIVNPDGQTVQTIQPRLYSTVMKPSTAIAVGGMMENVVKDGTGTAAALVGVRVAGKTGTAQDCSNLALQACQYNQDWFIAYAPVQDPKIAVAVTVSHQLNGFGGTIAAPIAKDVLEALGIGGGN